MVCIVIKCMTTIAKQIGRSGGFRVFWTLYCLDSDKSMNLVSKGFRLQSLR